MPPGEGILVKLMKAKGGQQKAVKVSGLKQVGVTRGGVGRQVKAVVVRGHKVEVASNKGLNKMARGDGRGNGSNRGAADKTVLMMKIDTEQVNRLRLSADRKAANASNFHNSPRHFGMIKTMTTNERRIHQHADAT